MIIVGDIHEDFAVATDIAKEHPGELVVQIGDFGIGLGRNPEKSSLPDNLKFFQGNHDNHDECEQYENYLGRYGGMIAPNGERILFVGGAETAQIFRCKFTEGVDWWSSERLSDIELEEVIKYAVEFKPTIVLSHDGPAKPVRQMFSDILIVEDDPSPTREALQKILDLTSPQEWYFGHWHKDRQSQWKDTKLRCVGFKHRIHV